jgi:hypothetical protein
VTIGAQFWQTVVTAYVVMATYAVIGVAIGVLVRNQIVAAVGVLVWMLAVEQIVITSYPSVGKWMPWGATNALLQIGRSGPQGEAAVGTRGRATALRPMAAAVVLAVLLTPKRDVL